MYKTYVVFLINVKLNLHQVQENWRELNTFQCLLIKANKVSHNGDFLSGTENLEISMQTSRHVELSRPLFLLTLISNEDLLFKLSIATYASIK